MAKNHHRNGGAEDGQSMMDALVKAFEMLPSVGQKTAARFAYYFLERNRDAGLRLADALKAALANVEHCRECRNLSETPVCRICANKARDDEKLCVVGMPSDIQTIERTGIYQGRYFVLNGYLSPIDGVDAQTLGLDVLEHKLKKSTVREIILATNTTAEGEVTAHYIADMAKQYRILTTRIAHGIPFGGELEYTDINTIAHAFSGRKNYADDA